MPATWLTALSWAALAATFVSAGIIRRTSALPRRLSHQPVAST